MSADNPGAGVNKPYVEPALAGDNKAFDFSRELFTEDYEFVPPGEPLELSPVARMIGNAVPVRIGELLGKSILAHLKSINDARWLSRLIQHKDIYVELGMRKNRAVTTFVWNSKNAGRLRDLARAASC